MLRIASRTTACRIASFLARAKYILSKKDRETVKSNLRNAFPQAGEKEISLLARKTFENFGRYIIDFFSLTKNEDGYLDNVMHITGAENIDRALDFGKGCIILTAHFGNWELTGCAMAKQGYKINAVALAHADPRINELFIRQRIRCGIKVIPTGKAKADCLKALNRGEAVAILGDRPYADHGIEMDFFGKKTLAPRGAALFSLKNGSPIVLVFSYWENGGYRAVFEEPFVLKREGDIDKELAEISARFFRRFEHYIKKYPAQWYMFNRVWKEN